jgi:hypothetical protein
MENEPGTPRLFRSTCIAGWAAEQWGCVTTEQLARCGVSPRTIGRWVADGRLHRLHRGVYAVGHRSPAPEPRWQAALLAYGDDSVLIRYTSIALHGLGRPPQVVTVGLPRRARKQRGVEPHLSMPFERDEVVIRRGLRTTSIERTLLDLAVIGEPVERLAAEATAKRLTSIAKLKAYVERRAGARGSRRLRSCIEGDQTRSRVEREFVQWLKDRHIPVPLVRSGPATGRLPARQGTADDPRHAGPVAAGRRPARADPTQPACGRSPQVSASRPRRGRRRRLRRARCAPGRGGPRPRGRGR